MILTPEQMFIAIENYAAKELGIIGTPVIHIITKNDIEEGTLLTADDIYKVRVTTD